MRLARCHMQDAARDAETAALQRPKGQGIARQGKVDAESVALRRPETQEAVKQVEVDAESAQLQKPEGQQVTFPKHLQDLRCLPKHQLPLLSSTSRILETLCGVRVISVPFSVGMSSPFTKAETERLDTADQAYCLSRQQRLCRVGCKGSSEGG